MKKFAFAVLCLSVTFAGFGHISNRPIVAQDKGGEVRFPAGTEPVPLPKPFAISTLSAEQLYVVDSDIAVLLFDSPRGLVKVTKEVGPLRVRARFVDGTGTETRTFKGKQLYLVEAVSAGKVELIVVPVSASEESAALRKTLDVLGAAPTPTPPDPGPLPIVDKLAIVVVWESADATPDVAATMKDIAFWRSLETRGVEWWQFDKDQAVVAAKGYNVYVQQHGLPCIVYMSPKGKVLTSGKLGTKADIDTTVKKLTGK